ncbi:MAG: plastocyanin/azurin family copper-binding protein [Gammaproteobacteria bacterium]
MMNARLFLLGMLTLSLVATSGFGSDGQSEQESPEHQAVTVEIKNLQFVPNEVVVPAGTTINWVNLDPVDHDVTSGVSIIGRKTRDLKQTKFPDGKFGSGLFGKDKTFSVTLGEKGEYKYYCNIHPFMIAKIVVK